MPVSTTHPQWLPTPEAARELQCSEAHLKRNRDINDGFLIAKRHWKFGSGRAILWNIEAISDLFHKRRMDAFKQRKQEAVK